VCAFCILHFVEGRLFVCKAKDKNKPMDPKLTSTGEILFEKLEKAAVQVYKDRLVTLAVFGSWAGKRNTADSDLDVLVVSEDLPRRRMARVKEFEKVEAVLEEGLESLRKEGIYTYFSPVFKTPEEVRAGSLLFLDMLYELGFCLTGTHFFQDISRPSEKDSINWERNGSRKGRSGIGF